MLFHQRYIKIGYDDPRAVVYKQSITLKNAPRSTSSLYTPKLENILYTPDSSNTEKSSVDGLLTAIDVIPNPVAKSELTQTPVSSNETNLTNNPSNPSNPSHKYKYARPLSGIPPTKKLPITAKNAASSTINTKKDKWWEKYT